MLWPLFAHVCGHVNGPRQWPTSFVIGGIVQCLVSGAPSPDVGHLSVHPVGIWIRNGVVDKFQRALTREREEAVFKLLEVTVSNLPLGDWRASAFNQVDRGSTAIVGSFPTDYTAHGGGGRW